MWFNAIPTPISDLGHYAGRIFEDDRGEFQRLYCAREFAHNNHRFRIVQANRSLTTAAGTVRGLHYQVPPHAETKVVQCIRGRVWDVAVDLRRQSETFLQWHAVELSDTNQQVIVVPPGFAHGFQALEDDSELLYFHSHEYVPEAEAGIAHNDPIVAVEWPLTALNISDRDRAFDRLTMKFTGLEL